MNKDNTNNKNNSFLIFLTVIFLGMLIFYYVQNTPSYALFKLKNNTFISSHERDTTISFKMSSDEINNKKLKEAIQEIDGSYFDLKEIVHPHTNSYYQKYILSSADKTLQGERVYENNTAYIKTPTYHKVIKLTPSEIGLDSGALNYIFDKNDFKKFSKNSIFSMNKNIQTSKIEISGKINESTSDEILRLFIERALSSGQYRNIFAENAAIKNKLLKEDIPDSVLSIRNETLEETLNNVFENFKSNFEVKSGYLTISMTNEYELENYYLEIELIHKTSNKPASILVSQTFKAIEEDSSLKSKILKKDVPIINYKSMEDMKDFTGFDNSNYNSLDNYQNVAEENTGFTAKDMLEENIEFDIENDGKVMSQDMLFDFDKIK